MRTLNTDHLLQCIKILEASLDRLIASKPDSVDYEVFCNAAIKGFELSLETAGKLLRKALKTYMGNPRTVDELTYKDLFRQANKHGLLDTPAVERWFAYRDSRNNTAHDYGIGFGNSTLKLMPKFLEDAKALQKILETKLDSNNAKP